MDRLQAHSELQQYRVEHANTDRQRETETDRGDEPNGARLTKPGRQAVNLPGCGSFVRETRLRPCCYLLITPHIRLRILSAALLRAMDGVSNHNLYY